MSGAKHPDMILPGVEPHLPYRKDDYRAAIVREFWRNFAIASRWLDRNWFQTCMAVATFGCVLAIATAEPENVGHAVKALVSSAVRG